MINKAQQISKPITVEGSHPFKGIAGSITNRGTCSATVNGILLQPGDGFDIPFLDRETEYDQSYTITFEAGPTDQKLVIMLSSVIYPVDPALKTRVETLKQETC